MGDGKGGVMVIVGEETKGYEVVAMVVEERKGGARGDLEESGAGGDRTCPLYW